jgi:hypothetical protein
VISHRLIQRVSNPIHFPVTVVLRSAWSCAAFLALASAWPCAANPILFSESRSVTAWATSLPGNPGLIDASSSPGTFGLFTASAQRSAPGGFGSVQHVSTITPTEFTLHTALTAQAASGQFSGFATTYSEVYAGTLFQVSFQLADATPISISAYNSFFSGDAHLVSAGGEIPLAWGGTPSDPFGNYLNFSQLLAPGLYTFSSNQALHFVASGNQVDGRSQQFEMTVRVGALASVPDSAATVILLGIGLATLCLGAGTRGGIVGRANWSTEP